MKEQLDGVVRKEGVAEAEEGNVETVGQGRGGIAVVRVRVGYDHGLGFGVEGLQGGDDSFLVSLVGGTGVNNDNLLPADEIGIRPRPGHGRRVGRNQPPDVGVSLGEGAFDDEPPGHDKTCQVYQT